MGNLEDIIRKHRANADYYVRHLRVDPSMLCRERPGAYYNRFMFPVIFGSVEQRRFMRDALKTKGVDTATPYEEIVEGATKSYGYRGDCPSAEKLLKTTVVIPSYYRLTERAIERIVRSFNSALERMAALDRRAQP
jgi:dTDP-4-amino-4,6-dideoxygalactose transaminase